MQVGPVSLDTGSLGHDVRIPAPPHPVVQALHARQDARMRPTDAARSLRGQRCMRPDPDQGGVTPRIPQEGPGGWGYFAGGGVGWAG